MIQVWQLQEAKNKFSQMLNDAIEDGPQIITRRGVKVAVVLSHKEYKKIMASQQKLSTFFQNSPLANVEIDLSRDKSPIREEIVL